MEKNIAFDPQGSRLWISIEMDGLYYITYTYQLWAATTDEPPVLTNPIKHGSNKIPHDDHYPVMNDYNQSEPVSKNTDRYIGVNFKIKATGNDDGYTLVVRLLQGNAFESATECGNVTTTGTVGSADGFKEDAVYIHLIV